MTEKGAVMMMIKFNLDTVQIQLGQMQLNRGKSKIVLIMSDIDCLTC